MIRFGFQIFQIWDEDWIACDLFEKKREREETVDIEKG